MKTRQIILGSTLAASLAGAAAVAGTNQAGTGAEAFLNLAPRPPMGWNSWDCFGCTVTEQLTKTNADYMARHLAQYGWQYIVVDIQWYEPQSTGWDYDPNPKPVLDDYGRLLPVEAKFPSSAGGKGFKPLADYIHARGLKFGLHLMRGIPRAAVKRNTPVLGSDYHAQDIADTNSTCRWNPDMFGVAMARPGAQAYYDSVFRLLAAWGVDYVKVDDLASPYHKAEIEAIRAAIDRCVRPMLLSLSPGPTPLAEARHVINHANLWRLTDDFWDNWTHLRHAFDTCNAWTPYRAPGHWPDPDMLPLGAIRVGPRMERNWTKFTPDEQRTLMTLWCISRAPLMFGGHLPWNDTFTLSLITNDEVLAVNQFSTGNRRLFCTNDIVAWIADVPESSDRYLALFYAPAVDIGFDAALASFRGDVIRGEPGAQAARIEASIAGAKRLYLRVNDGGDNVYWDHADWIEPTLTGPNGELKVTDLKWRSATAGWGQTATNRNVAGGPLLRDGKPVAWGIGTHAESVIEYELPAGYRTFAAAGVLDPGSRGEGSVQFEVYTERAVRVTATNATLRVSLVDLGFSGKVRLRDVWAQRDLGECSGSVRQDLPAHGAALFRLSPVRD
jgi:alpha-galactosidase